MHDNILCGTYNFTTIHYTDAVSLSPCAFLITKGFTWSEYLAAPPIAPATLPPPPPLLDLASGSVLRTALRWTLLLRIFVSWLYDLYDTYLYIEVSYRQHHSTHDAISVNTI